MAERLAFARKARGYDDAKSAAAAFGWNYNTYAQHENGTRDLKLEVAKRYGRALRVSAAWLLTGEGRGLARGPLEIVGLAGAGDDGVNFGEGQGPFGEARAPDWATDKTVAVEIRGTSLGPLLDGWAAYYDDRREPPTDDLDGSICVVGLPGGVYVKKLARGSRPGRWHLISNAQPPIFDVEVEWAAKIRGFGPPSDIL